MQMLLPTMDLLALRSQGVPTNVHLTAIAALWIVEKDNIMYSAYLLLYRAYTLPL